MHHDPPMMVEQQPMLVRAPVAAGHFPPPPQGDEDEEGDSCCCFANCDAWGRHPVSGMLCVFSYLSLAEFLRLFLPVTVNSLTLHLVVSTNDEKTQNDIGRVLQNKFWDKIRLWWLDPLSSLFSPDMTDEATLISIRKKILDRVANGMDPLEAQAAVARDVIATTLWFALAFQIGLMILMLALQIVSAELTKRRSLSSMQRHDGSSLWSVWAVSIAVLGMSCAAAKGLYISLVIGVIGIAASSWGLFGSDSGSGASNEGEAVYGAVQAVPGHAQHPMHGHPQYPMQEQPNGSWFPAPPAAMDPRSSEYNSQEPREGRRGRPSYAV